VTFPHFPSQPETMLQKETRVFREQFRRLANCILNKIFELTVRGSQRRNHALISLFLLLGIFFVLRAHSWADWRVAIGSLFAYLLDSTYALTYPDTLSLFFNFVFGAFSGPQTLRYLPVFLLPFFFALQAAATYLADIFELEKIETARDFILQVALTGSNHTIRFGKGDVIEKDRNSPVYLIGGPGQVVVELDTAALFERPNGKPRVIGPTIGGKAILEGFERFRQAIDLRDQSTESLDVESRSLDGVPVSARDVRLIFSVARGDNEPTAISPYPFDEQAINSLIYGQASKVVLDRSYSSEPPTSWTGAIQSLIRRELGGFMSKHRLAEYLASIGSPELQQAQQRENEIIKVSKAVLADGDDLEPREIPPPPNFQPRSVISNLFNQFTEGFSKNAANRGVQLSWIGVGTWKTPNEIILEKQLDAWRLSRENLGRGNPGALEGLRKEAQLKQIMRLVQNIPLTRFQESSDKEHNVIIQDLLIAYREQLIETIVLLSKSNKHVPTSIHAAIKHIESVLGIKHWVGDWSTAARPLSMLTPSDQRPSSVTSIPDTPFNSPEEAELYIDLLITTGRDVERAERLIEYERRFAPDAERIELIRRAIERYLKDNQ